MRPVEARRAPDHQRLAVGMFLHLVSGVVAAALRWMPCWGDPQGMVCASFKRGVVAPAQGIFLFGGINEYFVINAFVSHVDAANGTGRLRYALLALLGAAMPVFLAQQQAQALAGSRK